MSRVVVELAGPAGAGKTTLVRELQASRPATTTVGVQVGAPRLAAAILAGTPRLATARALAPGRWWTRDELRTLAYLGAWRRPVLEHHGSETMLLLDHGPVFRLAKLSAFGPPMVGSRTFDRWWTGLARDWGRLLDVVVYLDAPDDVLLRRIEARPRAHRVRGAHQDEATEFLARYRTSYRRALDAVAAGGSHVVEVDTSAHRPRQLAELVLAAIRDEPARSPR